MFIVYNISCAASFPIVVQCHCHMAIWFLWLLITILCPLCQDSPWQGLSYRVQLILSAHVWFYLFFFIPFYPFLCDLLLRDSYRQGFLFLDLLRRCLDYPILSRDHLDRFPAFLWLLSCYSYYDQEFIAFFHIIPSLWCTSWEKSLCECLALLW